MDEIDSKLVEFEEWAERLTSKVVYWKWDTQVRGFLAAALDQGTAQEFYDAGGSGDADWEWRLSGQIGFLSGLKLRRRSGVTPREVAPGTTVARLTTPVAAIAVKNRVFLVHGHDTGTKETVARYLGKLKLEPIILHEQANEGRTIIEKFEAFSDVGFAVVLLTPDDIGASAATPDKLASRARQNVILELGYFTGRIGRQRVCALYKPGVEIPSDFHGVLFVELDTTGGWKIKLAQELVQAKFDIDLQGVLQN